MALTASRSELNVALVGESEVSAMLEATKKQMAELEAKIRQLTGASKGQADAAKTAAAATVGVNDRMKGYAKNAEGVVEGIDKIKGATEKIIGVFGFLGMAVSAAIDVYKFFTEQSEKAREAQKKLIEELNRAEAQYTATMEAVKKLEEAEKASAAVTRTTGVQMAEDRLKLIKLTGDKAAEERGQAELEHEKELARVEELKVKQAELAEQRLVAVAQENDANSNLRMAERAIKELKDEQAAAEKVILASKQAINEAVDIEGAATAKHYAAARKAEADIKRVKHDIYVLTIDTVKPETVRAEQAKKTREELDKQKGALSGLLGLATQVADAMGAVLSFVGPKKKEPEKKDTPKGGGGKSKAEREREAAEKAEAEALRDAERMAAAQALYNKLAERQEEVRQAVADEAKLFEGLARKRYDVMATLDSIQTDFTEDDAVNKQLKEINKPFAEALKKELDEINKLLKTRVEFDYEIAGPEEEDALLKALGAQKTAYDKLNESIGQNVEMQSKAQDASVKLLEAYERGLPTKRLEEFQTGLGQLQQMSVPAFGEIGNVIGQVSDQFARYKAGQTSMTNATIQGASAIAGAIAKQVGGVKAEAGIRALFETAMGFATLSNPVESAGHFTAAAMFGLAAGGVLKTGASSGAGGQKAPATRTASTTATSSSGGGGPITNVYNLQTGIVDGQSTARAFRQAEQQARNTGMASAGGW
jgi:hypothetical protein